MFLWKFFTQLHVFLYRLTGGAFGSSMRGFKVLLLSTKGRKSGKIRTTPLGYFNLGENYLIVASNGGLERHPAWYYNLKTEPNIEIQVKDKLLSVTAKILTGGEYQKRWDEIIAQAPAFADYQKNTKREIPLVILQV